LSGTIYIYLGIGIIAVDVISFFVFQLLLRNKMKSFNEAWKKY